MLKIKLFNLKYKKDIKSFYLLRQSIPKKNIINQIDDQLTELYNITHPECILQKPNPAKIKSYIHDFYKLKEKEKFGCWVYYPWNNHLIHILPEELHTLLRTARNRNLITKAEQEMFYNARIGIVGLSVGNSVVNTMTYSGGPKHLRIADHDTLSVSNLNRIRAGIWQTGLKKTDVALQQIYEINPYADIISFDDGITLGNIEQFLVKPQKLDLLIDEMDSLYLKIQIRIYARKYQIPVMMVTDNGDGIMLDIERFDLDPSRPLFHGDIPEAELFSISPNISRPDAAKFIIRLVHPENVSRRMNESIYELGKSLYTWPQLGNTAFLAGCVASFAARKIITGETKFQGKHLLSFDDILE